MRYIPIPALVLVFCLGMAGTAWAKDDEHNASPESADRPHREERDARQTERREHARQRLETIRIARLTQELDLDPETAVHLIPLMKESDDLHRAHQDRRRVLEETARAELHAEAPDEDRLNELVEEFWDQEEAFIHNRRENFEEIADVLTPQQQVQLIEFLPRFQREIQGLMRDLRMQHRERQDRGPHDGDDRPSDRRGQSRDQDGDWWRDAPPGPGPDGP